MQSATPAESEAPSASAAASESAAPAASASPLALVTDASAVQKLFDAVRSAPAAALKPGGAKGGDALAKGVRDTAAKAATGMQADGALATGSLKEKQHLQTDITLAPDKCYAIVGYSKTVTDLDLHLMLPPGILSGQDTTDDNAPVIGRAPSPMCPVAAQAVTYKLDIYADQGSGDVAVQLYSTKAATKHP